MKNENYFQCIISKIVMKDVQALVEALSPLERKWKMIVSFLKAILAVQNFRSGSSSTTRGFGSETFFYGSGPANPNYCIIDFDPERCLYTVLGFF